MKRFFLIIGITLCVISGLCAQAEEVESDNGITVYIYKKVFEQPTKDKLQLFSDINDFIYWFNTDCIKNNTKYNMLDIKYANADSGKYRIESKMYIRGGLGIPLGIEYTLTILLKDGKYMCKIEIPEYTDGQKWNKLLRKNALPQVEEGCEKITNLINSRMKEMHQFDEDF